MSSLRKAAVTATDVACRAASRRQVVRAARFVYRRACLDVPNDPRTNGELRLQSWILDNCPAGQPVQVIDVGANAGHWSAAMLALARRAGRLAELDLHALEPSGYTFAQLRETLRGQPVRLCQVAASDRTGAATLYVTAPGAGVNSLHDSAAAGALETEQVPVTTLTEYVRQAGLGQLALVKIDTEGHELAVLRGAEPLLAAGRITAVQFEYNHCWVFSRTFLRDAFALLQPLGYRLGKLTPLGIEFYPAWDPDLETFVEGNYVACAPGVAVRLPSVPWWKAAGDHQFHETPAGE